MRAARVRELVDLPRSVGQEVGNAELGRDVDRLRDPIAPNESQKLLSDSSVICSRAATTSDPT